MSTGYHAFLSYSHADNRSKGRKWADWLHRELETYDVPADLVGRTTQRGSVPAAIYPVFQDEKELPADADLEAPIRRALESSDTLIVLCSPRATGSRYVNDEIRYFKQLGKSDRVLAVMLEGEPNADTPAKQQAGMRVEDECFPEALRHPVDGEGKVDRTVRVEPIAADVRPGGGRAMGWTTVNAYRDVLIRTGDLGKIEVEDRVRRYREQLDLARLKLIAGVLGLPLAELTKRDEAYQLQKARRRHRIIAGVAVALGVLALLAAVAGWIATEKADEARRAESRALDELYASRINEAALLLSQDNRTRCREVLWSIGPSRRAWEWGMLLGSADFAPFVLREGDGALLQERLAPFLDVTRTTDGIEKTLADANEREITSLLTEGTPHPDQEAVPDDARFEWLLTSPGGSLVARWATYGGRFGTPFEVVRNGGGTKLIDSSTRKHTGILQARFSEDGSCLFVFASASAAFVGQTDFVLPEGRPAAVIDAAAANAPDAAVLVLPIPHRTNIGPFFDPTGIGSSPEGLVDAEGVSLLEPRLADIDRHDWRFGIRGPWIDRVDEDVLIRVPFGDAVLTREPHVHFDTRGRAWALSEKEQAFLAPRLRRKGRYLVADWERGGGTSEILLVDMAGAAELWDLEAGTMRQVFAPDDLRPYKSDDDFNSFGGGTFSPDGRYVLLYLTGRTSRVRIYERESGRLVTTLVDHEGAPLDPFEFQQLRYGPSGYTSFFFSPRGTWCGISSHLGVFSGPDKAYGIAVFDPVSGRPVPSLSRQGVGSFGWDAAERVFLSTDGVDIRVQDVRTHRELRRWKAPGSAAGCVRPPVFLEGEERVLFEGRLFDTHAWRLMIDFGEDTLVTEDGTRLVRHGGAGVCEPLRLDAWKAWRGEDDVALTLADALLLYQTRVQDEARSGEGE